MDRIEEQSLHKAELLVEQAEGLTRSPSDWRKFLIPTVALCWSIFQLLLPQVLLLNSTFVRSIHLAFAISLVFLSFPAIRSTSAKEKLAKIFNGKLSFLYEAKQIPYIDILLAIVTATSALYMMIDYEGIITRQGNPSGSDIFVGILLIVSLLEAARRSLGPALPLIAGTFIIYSFFSESMPALIAFKNASITKLINKLTMSTEGIFGVPLDVSASTVFLFVLFGAILEKAGGGKYFIDLAFSLLGRYRGGPAKAAVLSSGLTGLVSGSSIANTVTTGTFTIPLMKKAGYSGVKAGAIEVAASVNGQIMPPIMGAAAFIIAEYCNLSYFEVVKASFIPAAISYIALIYITHLEALKHDIRPLKKEQLPNFKETLLGGLHFLFPLGLLIYQLMVERRSAQLSAYYAIICLSVLVLAVEGIKAVRNKHPIVEGFKHGLKTLFDSLIAGARAMMGIGVAVAAAGIIVGVVTLGLGGVITEVIEVLAMGNLILLLVITAIVSLILGMGLPTTANYIVMATLTAPVIVKVGGGLGLEVPLIAAHLFVFYFGILADATPPVGLAAFAAAAISKESPMATGIQGFIYSIRTAVLPFIFIFNLDLLLYKVTSLWHAAYIFTTSLIAMFAFAALFQGYFQRKNRWYEGILLALTTIMLLRPALFEEATALSRDNVLAAGLILFFVIAGLQRLRPDPNKVLN
ncbi:TRAP transporter permease [bacterium]|nr:TRAP transporter permease [bacterium]